RRFQDLGVDQAYAQVGQPYHRRHRVNHGGENGGDLAQVEQHHHRDQIHEARHGLHDVEYGQHDGAQPSETGHQDAQRYAYRDRYGHGHDHERQGLHGRVPQPDQADRAQHEAHRQAEQDP